MECTSEYFPPELLNWLDSILVFNKLPRESILKVVDLRLQDVAIRFKNRRIVMDVDAASKDWLARLATLKSMAHLLLLVLFVQMFCSRWLRSCFGEQ